MTKINDYRGTGKLRKIAKTEEYKRSNHNDFATSSELKQRQFCGVRHNSLTNNMEIWILGDMVQTVSKEQMLLNPNAANEAYEKIFALNTVRPDNPELRKLRGD